MTPARLYWRAAGCQPSPKPTEPHDGACYWCGLPMVGGVGARAGKNGVCDKMFSDHDAAKLPMATHVCVPCVWVFSGKGKDTIRTWSIVYREDRDPTYHEGVIESRHAPGWSLFAKDRWDLVRDVLLDPPDGPWVCAVGTSGKIHVLPFARVNRGDGEWSVRYERVTIRCSTEQFASVLYPVAALYCAGFTKDEILSGDPQPKKAHRIGLDLWEEHDETLRPWRGDLLLDLAVGLLNKDTADDTRQRAQSRHARHRG